MTLKLLLSFILFLGFLSAEASVFGGESSGGTDEELNANTTAWYLEAGRTIQACIQRSEDFDPQITNEYFKAQATAALEQWKTYLSARIDQPQNSFKIDFLSECSGSEDLIFKLGLRDSYVNEDIKKFNSPLAYAKRISYDQIEKWSKGYIFINSKITLQSINENTEDVNVKWHLPSLLNGILIHELGHVLGNGHLEETIMDGHQLYANLKTIIERHFYDSNPTINYIQSKFTAINQNKQLINIPGESTITFQDSQANQLLAFNTLMKRQPQGKTTLLLDQTHLSNNARFTLKVSDSIGSESFEFSKSRNPTVYKFNKSELLCVLVPLTNNTPERKDCYTSDAHQYFGSFKIGADEIIEVIISLNMNDQINIETFKGINKGQSIRLFKGFN